MTQDILNRNLQDWSKVFDLDEGNEAQPYKDTKGYWTIGRGHLIGRHLQELKLSQRMIDILFEEDISKHWSETVALFGPEYLRSISPARQVAVLTLVFTLGRLKLSKFFQVFPALREKRWNDAGDFLSKTKWAEDVDPLKRKDEGRDDRIVYMLKTGEYHPEYKVLQKD